MPSPFIGNITYLVRIQAVGFSQPLTVALGMNIPLFGFLGLP